MTRYSVIYTRHGDGWSASIPDLPDVVASGNTFVRTRVAVRAAMGRHLGVDPWDVDLEELVDAGESRYARLV